MEPEFISVVGSGGGMGGLMVRLFREAGFNVFEADAKDGDIQWEIVASCDVVLLAVPIKAMESVLSILGPHTRPDGAVIDICSLKKTPVELMLEYCRGEVIGGHPLFGPSVDSFSGQVFFVSPGRAGAYTEWFNRFLTRSGAKVVEIGAEEHDRFMSRVQVLRHMLLISFGLSLARLDFDVNELALSGPWFSKLVELLEHQLKQAPELYADLALENPAAGQVLEEFTKASGQIAEAVAGGDRQRVVDLIGEVTEYLEGNEAEKSDKQELTQINGNF